MQLIVSLAAYGLILFASTMVGFTVAKNFSDRPRQLQDLLTAMQILNTEIVYSAAPLPEALKSVARSTGGPVRYFFLKVSALLEEWHTAKDAWEQALRELQENSALLRPDFEVLYSLGQALGISNREDQQRHLLLSMKRLEGLYHSATVDSHKNERLWRYLGVLIGVVIVIILI